MYGIVVLDVCRLNISAHIVHPTLAALLHFIDDDTLQLTVREGFPRLESQVVTTELDNLLHHVEAQLIASRQELLDAPYDTLLFVHLRLRPALERLLEGRAEHLADHIVANLAETALPLGALHATLLRQLSLGAIVSQQRQAVLRVFPTLVDGLLHAGFILQFQTLTGVIFRIPHHLAVVFHLRTLIGLQRIVILPDDGNRLSLSVIEQLRVIAHATASS